MKLPAQLETMKFIWNCDKAEINDTHSGIINLMAILRPLILLTTSGYIQLAITPLVAVAVVVVMCAREVLPQMHR